MAGGSAPDPPKPLKHPYYPWDLKLAHYVENKWSTEALLAMAGACAVVAVVLGWKISGHYRKDFCLLRRLSLCWFMLCFLVHTVLEVSV